MEKPIERRNRDHRQLHQLIAGLTDGIILVDLDQTILWANDAALRLHGVKALKDLGSDIDDYRQRFKLTYRNKHAVKNGEISIDRVVAGEKSDPVIVEVCRANDPDDSRIHSLRFQAITGDDGAPDYIVLVVEDETARYDAEDRFESAFNANPAPAMICRLADLRYVRVNRGFLEMTGYTKDDIIGRTTYEFDILAGSRGREAAIERLREGKTVPQNEADLALPDGTTKCVIVAGQPIELSDEPCMLFTFADLEPRRRAEKALQQSEERFSKAFRLSPVAATICRLDGLRFIEANEAFTELTGYGKDRIIGRSAHDLDLWTNAAARTAFEALLVDSGSVRDVEFRLRTADGADADCLLSAERILIDDVECVLSIVSDVTDLKRTEGELMEAIEAVMSDATWFSRKILEKLAGLRRGSTGAAAGADLDALSDRERDVLNLICEGMADKDIAEALNLSRHTIRNHVSSLYRKIDVSRRSAAVVWARERGVTGRRKSDSRKKGQ